MTDSGTVSSGREGEDWVLARNCSREATNEVWEVGRWKWAEEEGEELRRGEREERKMRREKPSMESAMRMIRYLDLEICLPAIFSDQLVFVDVFMLVGR